MTDLSSRPKRSEVEGSAFRAPDVLTSARCWWIVCLVYAALFAFSGRHAMNPDGLSYIDMASAALTGGPAKLVNGLWSPGYPALIALAFFIFRPSPGQEFPLVHVVNLLLFAFALWAFSVFFRSCLGAAYGEKSASEGTRRYLTPFAYCTFLWFTLRLVGTEVVTPDLGVVAAVFLAAGISCHLGQPGSSWKRYAALGFVLGAGYYFKAIVLPLGVILLVILFFALPRAGNTTRLKLLLSLSLSFLVLLLVAAPLIAGLSLQAKSLSFGDAGRVNYLWHVNKLPWSFVEENKAGTGVEHPLKILSTTPLTWQFSGPDNGAENSTYPFGYDGSYWWAGVKPRFNMRQQAVELKESLSVYKEMVLDAMPFFSGLFVLWGFSLYEKPRRAAPETPSRIAWWYVAWPLAACLMYAFVHTEPRYVSPFLALFFVAFYGALMLRVNRRVAVAVCSTVLLAVMIPFTLHLANKSLGIAEDLVHPKTPEYQLAALGLRELGLKPGDRLAIVGNGDDCYYAHYDRLHVVAQVPDQQQFWQLSEPELRSFSERLASIGVNAIVTSDRPDVSAPADWKDVELSNSARLSVLLLPQPDRAQSR